MATIYNKACELWLKLQQDNTLRIAVMVEVNGALEVFLTTYDALDGDWPPTREQIKVSRFEHCWRIHS